MNLSASYTEFAAECAPLCQSLPLILHHQLEINSLLQKYIAKKDENSLESLLDLVTNFAHDLGPDYEPYYPSTLQILMDLTKTFHITIVEWTFNCIAYLFKYLYRLLVENLVPTLKLLSPLLSTSRNVDPDSPDHKKREFVGRFTAEALSFLIRKSTGESLQKTVNYIVGKVAHSESICNEDHLEYFESCAILFIETMKSSPGTLHSRSENTLNALFKASETIIEPEFMPRIADLYAAIFMDLLEHASAENAQILFHHLYKFTDISVNLFTENSAKKSNLSPNYLVIPSKLTYALSSLRRGSKVMDWNSLYLNLDKILAALEASSVSSISDLQSLPEPLIEACVGPLSLSDLKYSAAYSVKIQGRLLEIASGLLYLPFAQTFLDVSPDKFKTFSYSFISKYISKYHSERHLDIAYILSSLNSHSLLNKTGATNTVAISGTFKVPPTSEFINETIDRIQGYKKFAFDQDVNTNVTLWWDLEVIRISLSASKDTINIQKLFEILIHEFHHVGHSHARTRSADKKESQDHVLLRASLVGKLLSIASSMAKISVEDKLQVVLPILKYFTSFSSSLDFVQGFNDLLASLIRERAFEHYEKLGSRVFDNQQFTEFGTALAANLLSPSAPLRSLSLNTIAQLYIVSQDPVPKMISQCQDIDSMKLDLANSRSIPNQIKSLGSAYTVTAVNTIADVAVVNFLCGLLNVKFKPATDGAIEALSKAAERSGSEIWTILFNWISFEKAEPKLSDDEIDEYSLEKIETEPLPDALSLQNEAVTAWPQIGDPISRNITTTSLISLFIYTNTIENSTLLRVKQSVEIPHPASNRRYMSLQAITHVPWLAETHVEELLPFILEDDDYLEEDEEADETVATAVSGAAPSVNSWTMKEKCLLMDTFSNFKHPEKFTHSQELYDRYLYLLSHSQVVIQKRALKCIDTFRNPIIHKYLENLDWLLDNVRFRDELQYLFQNTGDNAVHQDERPVIMPLVIRLLFGRSQISREGRRAAVIQSLGNVPAEYIRQFVILATDRIEAQGFFSKPAADVTDSKVIPLSKDLSMVAKDTVFSLKDLRRHMGFLSMIEDMLKDLRTHLKSSLDIVLEAIMYCFYIAQNNNSGGAQELAHSREGTILKTITNAGVRCLHLLFETFEKDDSISLFSMFNTVYKHVIHPTLKTLYTNDIKYPNLWFKLLLLFSRSKKYWTLLAHDKCALYSRYVEATQRPAIGDRVVENVIDSVASVLYLKESFDKTTSVETKSTWTALMDASVPVVLSSMPALFSRESTPPFILKKESGLLVRLTTSGFITDKKIRDELIKVCLAAMDKPTKKVSLRVKGDMLESLSTILLDSDIPSSQLVDAYYGLSKLFLEFEEVYPRKSLCKLYTVFGVRVPRFQRVSKLLADLNAFSKDRIGSPDYETRLEAFKTINENIYADINPEEWQPLLYNFLFYIQDPDELATREGSAYGLRRFVDCFAQKKSQQEAQPFVDLLEKIVIPQIRLGVLYPEDLIRHWYINILGYLVKAGNWYHAFDDMKSLLGEDNSDNSEDKQDKDNNKAEGLGSAPKTDNFFRNIISVHIPSREKAIKDITVVAKKNLLTDPSISGFLLPIVEHYVDYSNEPNSPLTVACVKAISELCKHLTWDEYKGITVRYVSFVKSKPMNMIVNTRLVNAVADVFVYEDEDEDTDGEDEDKKMKDAKTPGPGIVLHENLPSQDLISKFILEFVLPILEDSISVEQEDILRERIALLTPIVKFLKALPYKQFVFKLPGVLTSTCQLLRSRSENMRNKVRKVLRQVTHLLGPAYFPFLVKELRTALRRGSHLHILGFTLFTLLSELSPVLEPGDLDNVMDLIPGIMMEDIFGTIGSEKDAEDYRSRLMEVKKQKSFDTAELLAQNISLSKFNALLDPVRSILLYQKLNAQTERKVEDLLRRYSLGLKQNKLADSRDVLVLAYELYKMTQDLETEEKAALKAQREEEDNDVLMEQEYYAIDHFKVDIGNQGAKLTNKQLARKNEREKRSVFGNGPKPKYFYTDNLHLIINFVFEIIRRVLIKHSDLLTSENVAEFVPMLGSQITSKFENVQISALKLLVVIFRVKIPGALDDKTIVETYVYEVIQIVRTSATTNTDLCQSALQFMTAILNHKHDIAIPEPALAYLLERIKPDIEEPERYNTTFSFVRAVIGRAILIPEVYDVMDKVAAVMVTNQTKTTRDVCRSTYLEFITEYPQGKQRIKQQFKFLVDNLQYKGIDGRLSVMELIHLLIQHIDDSHLEQVITSFFVALALVLINDDSSSAREMAAVLIKQLFSRASGAELEIINKYCISWLKTPITNPLLLRGGIQISSLYLEELGIHKNAQIVPLAQSRISEILELADMTKLEQNKEEEQKEYLDSDYVSPFGKEEDEEDTTKPAVEWGLTYFAVQLFTKIAELEPELVFSKTYKSRWALLENIMLYPHSWVRMASSRLLGILLAAIQENREDESKPKYPAIEEFVSTASYTGEPAQFSYVSLADNFIKQLGTPSISSEMALQIAKNLVIVCTQFERYEIQHVEGEAEEAAQKADLQQSNDNSALKWLIIQLSLILRTERRAFDLYESKNSIIQIIASVVQSFSVDRVISLSPSIIYGLYPYIEGLIVSAGDSSDPKAKKQHALQTLSQEAVELLREKVGTTEYMQAYSVVHSRVLATRTERKRQRAVEAVSDPAAFAAKKLELRAKKRSKRKEREDELKSGIAGVKRVRGVRYWDEGGNEDKTKKKKKRGSKSSLAL